MQQKGEGAILDEISGFLEWKAAFLARKARNGFHQRLCNLVEKIIAYQDYQTYDIS